MFYKIYIDSIAVWFVMFNYEMDQLSKIADVFVEDGLIPNGQNPPVSQEERAARVQDLQKSLQSYFETVEKGYQQVVLQTLP